MDVRDLDAVVEVADVIQIGARNMQNYTLLTEVGRAGKPVLLKRGLSATLEELLMAAEYVLKEGNPNVLLCERGIRTFEPGYRFTLDLMAVPVLRELTHLPVIVDPSHAAGKRSLVEPLSLAAAAAGADGLIVEVHPCPEEAVCDGPQALLAEEFARLPAQGRGRGRAGGQVPSSRVDADNRPRRGADRRLDRPRSQGARRGRGGGGLRPRPERLERARELGAVDRVATSLAEALDGAELCFACAPVGALPGLVAEALSAAGPDCAVSDVGSTKQDLLGAIDDPRFVGGHPIAGAETAGVEHARGDLFNGAVWYLTPQASSGRPALRAAAPLRGRPRRPPGGGRPRDARPAGGGRSATCPTCWPTSSWPRPPAG